jgi:hypothetical protein
VSNKFIALKYYKMGSIKMYKERIKFYAFYAENLKIENSPNNN